MKSTRDILYEECRGKCMLDNDSGMRFRTDVRSALGGRSFVDFPIFWSSLFSICSAFSVLSDYFSLTLPKAKRKDLKYRMI